MKLAVNYSDTLIDLLNENPELPVDFIKVPTKPFPDSFSQFDKGLSYRRLLPHPAQPGVISLGHPSSEERYNREIVAKIIDLTNPAYLSTHLEAKLDFFPSFEREQHQFHPGLKKTLSCRFLESIKLVKETTGLPLALENFPYYSWWRHFKIGSDPAFIAELCEVGDCHFLLDIAHARCSAWYFGIPVEQYLEMLPLQRLVEIHLAGVDYRAEGIRDTHTKLTDEDYQLFNFVLEKTKPEIVTIEYGGLPDWILNQGGSYEPIRRNDALELKEIIGQILTMINDE
ncbi:MAG: DUF692 family protein [Firmicutes bacterium]|nr:DUF692 family protein [Bacillota bacterium]